MIAIFQAAIVVSEAYIVLLSDQPTTFRSAKSSIAVRYNHPSPVLI
jgi:hypothetical protein